jgi:hypothetical protein
MIKSDSLDNITLDSDDIKTIERFENNYYNHKNKLQNGGNNKLENNIVRLFNYYLLSQNQIGGGYNGNLTNIIQTRLDNKIAELIINSNYFNLANNFEGGNNETETLSSTSVSPNTVTNNKKDENDEDEDDEDDEVVTDTSLTSPQEVKTDTVESDTSLTSPQEVKTDTVESDTSLTSPQEVKTDKTSQLEKEIKKILIEKINNANTQLIDYIHKLNINEIVSKYINNKINSNNIV